MSPTARHTTPTSQDSGAEPADPATGRIASRLSDRIIAIATLALAVTLLVLSWAFPDPGQPEDPGTAALPRLIGVSLLILGIVLFLHAERRIIAPEPGSRLRTAVMVAVGIGYALAIEPFGFVLATLAFMVLALLIMGLRSPLRVAGVPIVVTLGVHYLFTAALGVYLPAGLIEGVLP